jgi:two-component system LytT family sensor kinase
MNSDAAPVMQRPWLRVAAIWAGVGLFEGTQTVVSMRAVGMHHAWAELFAYLALSWLPWVLATPFVMRLGARRPLWPLHASAWWRHGAAWAVAGVVAAGWSAALEHVLNPWTPLAPPMPFITLFADKTYDRLLSSLIVYYCIVAAGAVIDSRERLARQRAEAAELAERLVRAQLEALRHQVEPHFLFNALNAVSGLVREGRNDQAVETIARISEFLRRTLHGPDTQQAALEEELQLARLYLAIQQVRFGERLRVGVEVAPELLRAHVPRLILQPLLENAIKHGLARRAQPGAIAIAANRVDDRLVLTVYNDGPPTPAATAGDTPSLGLRNVRGRLAGLHGDAASLTLANVADVARQGVLVTLALPLVVPA